MDVRIFTISATTAACFFFVVMAESPGAPAADRTDRARRFVELLAEGDFDGARDHFDARMKAAVSAEKLVDIWQTVIAQAGAFKKQTTIRAEAAPPYGIVFVTCEFKKL